MVSVLRFLADPIDLQEEIKHRDDLAESIRREHFIVARRIQAWIRGILTRNHLRLLHRCATTIQRHWRGYRVRISVDLYLVERVHQIWQDYYDRMATRIQVLWRGYWVRKTVLDLPKMRRWLKDVYARNLETVEDMKRFRQNELDYAEYVLEHESMQWILFILFKLHHLLRTKQQPGIITRIDKTRCTFIEEMMKCFKYRHYTREKISCYDCKIDPKPSLIFRGTYYERCEREIRQVERDLESGVVSIFRSEPYEEHEKIIRELNQIYQEAYLHSTYETTCPPNGLTKQAQKKETCNLKKRCIVQIPRHQATKLYDQIKMMDCYLYQLHLKCPIHDVAVSI